MKDDLISIDVKVHHDTKGAVLVTVDGNRAGAVWLPLSAIELTPGRRDPSHAVVTLTEALAASKGLV